MGFKRTLLKDLSKVRGEKTHLTGKRIKKEEIKSRYEVQIIAVLGV